MPHIKQRALAALAFAATLAAATHARAGVSVLFDLDDRRACPFPALRRHYRWADPSAPTA